MWCQIDPLPSSVVDIGVLIVLEQKLHLYNPTSLSTVKCSFSMISDVNILIIAKEFLLELIDDNNLDQIYQPITMIPLIVSTCLFLDFEIFLYHQIWLTKLY